MAVKSAVLHRKCYIIHKTELGLGLRLGLAACVRVRIGLRLVL